MGQSAAALNDILFRLGNAVRDGAEDVADTDRRAAGAWGRSGPDPDTQTLCGPARKGEPSGTAQYFSAPFLNAPSPLPDVASG